MNAAPATATRDRFTVDTRPEDRRRPFHGVYAAAWETARDYGTDQARKMR
jgi:hypothetical protein